ncbi:hypothetical protein FACS18949_11710 [Clostridia bacterium]|nr:hypothetical protein FACS189425_06540 [Clostridia bacterium]GHV34868.1 hypothetical protein FACS18949_11710 [Clostridia bacterium]
MLNNRNLPGRLMSKLLGKLHTDDDSGLLSNQYKPVMSDEAKSKYYMETHKLQQCHVNQWNSFSQKVDFRGKRVLELGGSNMPSELLLDDLGAEKYVCIDKVMPYQLNMWEEHYSKIKMYEKEELSLNDALNNFDHICYRMFGEEITDDFVEQFDVCVSLNCLEHVKTMDETLFNVHKSLKPGGVFIANFGPVFSCECGSHFYWRNECNFNNLGPLSPFPHLLLSFDEIVERLRTAFPETHIGEITHAAYGVKKGAHNYVNELFFEDYEVYLKHSPFQKFSIRPFWKTAVAPQTYKALRKRFPQYRRFDVYAVELIAIK